LIFPKSWWRLTWLWLFKGGYVQDQGKNSVKRPLSVGSIRAAIVALSLGVCALSLTLAVFSGFESLLSSRVIEKNGHFRFEASDWYNFASLPDSLEEFPVAMKDAEMFWTAPVMIVGKEAGRGVRAEVRRSFLSLKDKPIQIPRFVSATLAQSLADYLGIKEGDTFSVVIPGYLKKAIPLKLKSLDGLGIHHLDSRRIVLDEVELTSYISKHHPDVFSRRLGDFHAMRFFLDPSLNRANNAEMSGMAQSLQTYMEKITGDSVSRISSWKEEQKNFFGGIAHDKRLVSVVMAMLTIVAALNVATSLLVLFFEKDRQIALIRALGMSKRQLMRWTSLQGFFMGIVATAIGFSLSYLLSFVLPSLPFLKLPADIYNVSQLPIRFEFIEQSFVFGFGMLSAFGVASLLGFMLSRMSIVSVLGHRR